MNEQLKVLPGSPGDCEPCVVRVQYERDLVLGIPATVTAEEVQVAILRATQRQQDRVIGWRILRQ